MWLLQGGVWDVELAESGPHVSAFFAVPGERRVSSSLAASSLLRPSPACPWGMDTGQPKRNLHEKFLAP